MASEQPRGVAMIVGCGSKHDKDGTDAELPPESRWGLGGALALRFAAAGYHVACCSRRAEVREEVAAAVAAQGGRATPVACDVTDEESVKAAFAAVDAVVAESGGRLSCVVFNCAPPFPPGVSFMNLPAPQDVDPSYLQAGFNVGVTGCVRVAKEALPRLRAPVEGDVGGSFLISGATMAVRGGANFACMAPVKAALRSYGQSLYQSWAPLGVHVAHVIIDGVIESPNTKAMSKTLQKPAHLADAYVGLHHQPPTVWSYELQLTHMGAALGMRL